MLRPRIIPCLLVHDNGLVKSKNFRDYKYVGDPINAVKIFNEKEADELMVLDIDATKKGNEPNFMLISKLAAECRMPLCYGGGIKSPDHAKRIIDLGVEKVAISSAAVENPSLISEIADAVGRQSVVTVIDVKKQQGFFKSGYRVCTRNGSVDHKVDPIELALEFQNHGAGEIVLNSIDLDGMMSGYDVELAIRAKSAIKVPLTILGGAGSISDIEKLLKSCGIIGAAAGSLFVFKGQFRAVLINYPTQTQRDELFEKVFGI